MPSLSVCSMIAMSQTRSEAEKIVRRWILDNPQLGQPVNAVRTPSAQSKYQGRQGAKKVKLLEQASDEHRRLTPESATSYRALSARCNYLAQDRTDISFTAKELCRDFAVPTAQSLG